MPAPVLDYASPKSSVLSPLAWLLMGMTMAAVICAAWVGFQSYTNYRLRNRVRTEGHISPLQLFRGQTELFKIQHNDVPPDPARILLQMTHATNLAGDIGGIRSTSDYPFGPYLTDPIVNPRNGRTEVGPAPAPGIGWVYTVRGTDFTLQAVNTTGTGVLPY
jgi:hypothetical protein